jgi:hypothetical protein
MSANFKPIPQAYRDESGAYTHRTPLT